MLEPTIEHTLSGQYPNKYAMHDLGSNFPNATGHPDGNDEYIPVEECGNILMMGLALVQSLQYEDDTAAGSIWSSLGGGDFDPNPAISAFPLNKLDKRDGVIGLDDSWGGSTKGQQQGEKWLERSYRLWKQWTGYLVEFSLEPLNQRMYPRASRRCLLKPTSVYRRFRWPSPLANQPRTKRYHRHSCDERACGDHRQ